MRTRELCVAETPLLAASAKLPSTPTLAGRPKAEACACETVMLTRQGAASPVETRMRAMNVFSSDATIASAKVRLSAPPLVESTAETAALARSCVAENVAAPPPGAAAGATVSEPAPIAV